MQVINVLAVIRGVTERLNEAANYADNRVCQTN